MALVLYTPLAEHDLKEIGRYLAEQSGSDAVAYRFLDAIDARCSQYAMRPELAERYGDVPDVRRFPIGNYVVFYRPSVGGIEILRVLHGSRDIPTIFRS